MRTSPGRLQKRVMECDVEGARTWWSELSETRKVVRRPKEKFVREDSSALCLNFVEEELFDVNIDGRSSATEAHFWLGVLVIQDRMLFPCSQTYEKETQPLPTPDDRRNDIPELARQSAEIFL